MHTLSEEAPRLVLNLPGSQSEHDAVPFSDAYLPRGHRRQSDSVEARSVLLYLPTVQLVHDVAPSEMLEYRPRAQSKHETVPFLAVY